MVKLSSTLSLGSYSVKLGESNYSSSSFLANNSEWSGWAIDPLT